MCVSAAVKAVIIIINVVFGLLGLTIFVTGALLKWGTPVLLPVLQTYVTSLPVVSQAAGVGSVDTSGVSLDLSQYTGPVGDVCICIGLGLLSLCFLGCCSACCKNTICLTVYAIILGCFAVAKLGVVLFYIVSWATVETQLKDLMKTSITNNYEGIKGTDATSVAWNVANLQLACCGVDNYTDFNSASKWMRSVTINQTIDGTQYVQNVTLMTPFSCCKMSGTLPNFSPVQYNCSYAPSSVNSNQDTGCWTSLHTTYVNPYKWYIGVTWLIIIALEVALMILAIFLCCAEKSVVPV